MPCGLLAAPSFVELSVIDYASKILLSGGVNLIQQQINNYAGNRHIKPEW
jgi:hypothetical protein